MAGYGFTPAQKILLMALSDGPLHRDSVHDKVFHALNSRGFIVATTRQDGREGYWVELTRDGHSVAAGLQIEIDEEIRKADRERLRRLVEAVYDDNDSHYVHRPIWLARTVSPESLDHYITTIDKLNGLLVAARRIQAQKGDDGDQQGS
jgi:hypothetical protein